MAADANIFQQYLKAPKSIMDYTAEADQADARKNALQESVLALQKGQMDMANAADVSRQRNALRDAISSGQIDLSNPDHVSRALTIAPDVAPALLKTVQEGATARAKAGLDTAQAGHATAQTADQVYKTRIAKSDQAIKDISGFTSPQDALASLDQHVAAGDVDPQKAQMIRASIPQNPADFPKWQLGMLKNIMAAKDQIAQVSPDANARLQAQTSTSNNAATNATSRANNRDTITKDYNVAGLNPDGTPGTANDSMIDAIGQYKVAPPNGMALRNPRMQQILADVTAKYPDFDATQYGARQTAAKAFSTGPQAQQVQAGNTALNHLDTIEQLALAQKNGNIQLFNKLANAYAAQTGQAAPTNLQAAITMVAPEITKAVVGAGGGIEDRAKAAAALNPNFSPDQLLGSVGTIKELFGGRLAETARTYQRSTGRKDFGETFLSPAAQKVLAARAAAAGETVPAAAVPPDIAAILQKHGGK